ncbi:uncharacterized protein LOC128371398 [Scomber scombrus]|uniref:Uncharacterized protein LOC128371398 n=2 Tax=Scomber scombrus TaxID=13677 RepID=A0AAV1P988_SCOSC
MSSMEIFFLSIAFLLGGLSDMKTEAMSVTGELGAKIEIGCSHSNAFTNVKYFCNNACSNEDILISSKKRDSNGTYSIKDEGNTFFVTISKLTMDDSGTYWCGIERALWDTYSEVILTVKKVDKKEPDDDTTPSITPELNHKKSSKMLVYMGAGLGVVVLALAIILLMFFRYRNRDISTSSGKDQDTVYAAPSIQKQPLHAHIDTPSSTANEGQETNSRDHSINSSAVQHKDHSRDHTGNIYSNIAVSSESQIQPDSVFYSTVSFNKDTDSSTVTPHTATITYSTIRH